VRCGTRFGADDRSTKPASPSARHLASHFAAVRSLTPAAKAASASDHPAATRSTISRRLRAPQVPWRFWFHGSDLDPAYRRRLEERLGINFEASPEWRSSGPALSNA
jgi:hypothetical protein